MMTSPGDDAGGGILARSSSSASSNPRAPTSSSSRELDRGAKPGESPLQSNPARRVDRADDDHDRDGDEDDDDRGEEQAPHGGQLRRVNSTGVDDDRDDDDDVDDGHPGTSSSSSGGGSRSKITPPPPPPQQQPSKPGFPAVDHGDDDVDQAAGSFDCNICLELAQDPVVTLCGHLFCWPCLYKWMQLRPMSKECPVCKAPVHEDKVIPLYGRGCVESTSSEHRDAATSSMPEMEIPSRPPGHRPGSSSDPHHQASLAAWHHHARRLYDPYGGIGFVAGAAAGPGASARFGNVTFSAGFGLFPSLFRLQFHGFPDAPPPPGAMLPYGSLHAPPGSHHHHHHLRPVPPQLRPDQQETLLSRLLLFVGGVMILCFLYF